MPGLITPVYLDGLRWRLDDNFVGRGAQADEAFVAPGSQVQTDEFGADVLNLEVSCRTDKVNFFLPRKGQLDPIHQKLTYRSRSVTHGDDWNSRLSIQFNGFLDTSDRDEEPEFGVNERTVTLRNGTELTISVTYMAPAQSWQYALPDDPQRPRHKDDLKADDQTYEITEMRTSEDQNLSGLATLGELASAGYLFTKATRNTVFTRKKSGGVWRVSEQNEALLIATF